MSFWEFLVMLFKRASQTATKAGERVHLYLILGSTLALLLSRRGWISVPHVTDEALSDVLLIIVLCTFFSALFRQAYAALREEQDAKAKAQTEHATEVAALREQMASERSQAVSGLEAEIARLRAELEKKASDAPKREFRENVQG